MNSPKFSKIVQKVRKNRLKKDPIIELKKAEKYWNDKIKKMTPKQKEKWNEYLKAGQL